MHYLIVCAAAAQPPKPQRHVFCHCIYFADLYIPPIHFSPFLEHYQKAITGNALQSSSVQSSNKIIDERVQCSAVIKKSG
jgi:hypothetical protein